MGDDLTRWTERAHQTAREHGWWDDVDLVAWRQPEMSVDRKLAKLALVHAEVSEAVEALRRGADRPCDKEGLDLTALEEELADIIIRVCDFAGSLGIDLDRAVEVKHAYNEGRPYRHGGRLA